MEWLKCSFQKQKIWGTFTVFTTQIILLLLRTYKLHYECEPDGEKHRRLHIAKCKIRQLPDSSPIYSEVAAGMWISEVDGFSKGSSKICFSEGFWHRLDRGFLHIKLHSFINITIFYLQNRYDQSECVSEWVCVCACVHAVHTGWAWQTLAMSSQEAPYSMARAASLIISPAPWRRKTETC